MKYIFYKIARLLLSRIYSSETRIRQIYLESFNYWGLTGDNLLRIKWNPFYLWKYMQHFPHYE
jgi:hypothetical protein